MRTPVSIGSLLVALLVAPVGTAQTSKPGAAQAKPGPARPAPEKAKPTQTRPARPSVAPRGFISINGGYQATSNDFSSTWTFDYYADAAHATARYPVKGAFLFDAAGGVRVWRDLLVGASVSRFSRSDTVSITASAPHPFFFETREVTGTEPDIGHGETGIHLQGTWMLRPRGRVQVALFGGPTIYLVQQELVTMPNFVETYPYDTVTMAGATTKEQTATAVGFNLGADAWYGLSKRAAVGFLLRWARATANFEAPDTSAVNVHAGGLQVGAGLRVRFLEGKKPAAKGTPNVKGKK